MSSAPGVPHPEIPAHRDRSLLITEAQQAEMIADLVRLEHELDRVHRETEVPHAPSRALLDQLSAEMAGLFEEIRTGLRNAVTVEERIAHLDFTGEPPR